MDRRKRYKLIVCEVLFREICFCASQCNNIIDIVFMPKGLHDIGERDMSEKLQTEIDKVDISKYQAILLGYGLCNNGVRGLHSSLPIVIPRAHDCITLLFGSRKKYNDYFHEKPGTFFKSVGWVERDVNPNETENSITSQLKMDKTYQEYAEQYGEENAQYLMESLGNWFKNYKRITYIDTNVGNCEKHKGIAKNQADANGWEFEVAQGNISLLLRLLNGDWDTEDFLTIPLNNKIVTSHNDDSIVEFEDIK